MHCSSHAALEAKPFDEPFDETRRLALNEETVYHRSKAHAEKEILNLVNSGLPAVIVNPGTITGPYDFEPSILGKALIDFIHGKVPFLMEGVSDYADVRDIVNGIIEASKSGRVGERYLLTGEMLPMKKLPGLLSEITGKKL